MPHGIFGTDSLATPTNALLDKATAFFGATPKFWGRYFKAVGSPGEYNATVENPFFSQHQIPVLPIARQTTRVGGTSAQGFEDGSNNANAIIAAFGAPILKTSPRLVFLDVEGTKDNPSLTSGYFTGWTHGLQTAAGADNVTLLPAVYGRTLDTDTWEALIHAGSKGTKCFGAWVARAHNLACSVGPAVFNAQFAEPPVGLPFEVLIWQFALDCGALDYSQTNPAIDGTAELIERLILLPEAGA